MTKRTKRSLILVGSVLVLVIALGATVAFAQTDDDPVPPPDSEETVPPPDSEETVPPRPWGAHPGGRGGFKGFGGQLEGVTPKSELLAAELGVSEEDLQAAHAQVREEAMAQGPNGFRGHHGFGADNDHAALLAEALSEITGKSITEEDLQEAGANVQAKTLEELVDAGVLTQDQVDLMEAHRALKEVVDPRVLMSEVLGVDLEKAREEGTRLPELLGDMSFEDFATAMREAHEDAVNQAAADGVITEAQAEQILSGGFGGPGGFKGFGGHHGGFGGRGHHGGNGGPGGFKGFGPAGGNQAPTGISL
jgi:hypothetical protein